MPRIIIIEDDYGFPYPETKSLKSYSNPCEHCPNNPMNNPNASGFCNCVLPYMHQCTYGNYYSTSSFTI